LALDKYFNLFYDAVQLVDLLTIKNYNEWPLKKHTINIFLTLECEIYITLSGLEFNLVIIFAPCPICHMKSNPSIERIFCVERRNLRKPGWILALGSGFMDSGSAFRGWFSHSGNPQRGQRSPQTFVKSKHANCVLFFAYFHTLPGDPND